MITARIKATNACFTDRLMCLRNTTETRKNIPVTPGEMLSMAALIGKQLFSIRFTAHLLPRLQSELPHIFSALRRRPSEGISSPIPLIFTC
jgi:hypothetical protein